MRSNAARPGDWILVAPGRYHEQGDRRGPVSEEAGAAVQVRTPGIHIRGMDRNGVVIDGTQPGSPGCSSAGADQDLGRPTEGQAGRTQRDRGLEVDGVTIDNFTACNFLTGDGGGGNEIWWNGGDGTGTIGLGSFRGSYLSATSTLLLGDGRRRRVRHVRQQQRGPGQLTHTYASNMSDSGYYVGACPDLQPVSTTPTRSTRALGYSGTNSGGHLIIQHTEFDHNKTGFVTNSQNNDDAPSPQDGACPDSGIGPKPAPARAGSSRTTTSTTTTTRTCPARAAPSSARPAPAW